MKYSSLVALTGFTLLLLGWSTSAQAQGTALSYQGRLNDGAGAANGLYDVHFALYDAATGGTQQGAALTFNGLAISNGLLQVTLDFGSVFPGADRWLEIGTRTNGATAFVTLSPRQKVLSVPYAVTAAAVAAGGLPAGTYGNAVTFNNASNLFSGTFSGDGSGLSGVSATQLGGITAAGFWKTTGNTATAPPTNFLGTTDAQPLELRVNALRGLRLEPVLNDRNLSNALNVIAGSEANAVAPGVRGATIGGGGADAYYNTPAGNLVADNFGTIAGGVNNQILSNAWESAIGGGNGNWIAPGANRATIAGGWANVVGTNCAASQIGGGVQNLVQGNATDAVIAGGTLNSIKGSYAAVGGGAQNIGGDPFAAIHGGFGNQVVSSYGSGSTIGGGSNNVISYATFISSFGGSVSTIAGGAYNRVNGNAGTIGGGVSNLVANVATYGAPTIAGGNANQAVNFGAVGGGYLNNAGPTGTIPGGWANSAQGAYSFAAGYQANANNDGSFVWADSQATAYASDRANQFKIRAGGGLVLDVSGASGLNPSAMLINSTSGNGVGLYIAETSSDAALVINNSGTGDIIKGFDADFNGNPVFEVVNNGTVYSRAVALTSDRNAKEDFAAVQPSAILEKVAALPITEWNYKADAGVRHLGPVAQDFHAAFGLNGTDDKHISVVDEGGVALAAIQGLNQKLETELQAKDHELAELKRQVAELRRLVQQALPRQNQ